ncbi:MAG: hypothetical protein ACUVRI_11275 [Armatimonadota bacterium]
MRRVLILAVLTALFAVVASTVWAAYDWQLSLVKGSWQVGKVYWIGSQQEVYAGALKMNVMQYDSAHQKIIASYYAWMYCIDKNWFNSNDWYERVVGGIPSNNTPMLTKEKWARKVWLIKKYGWESWLNPENATGLQLAIWEVITDTRLDLTTGDFYVVSGFSAGAINYANTLLASVQAAPQSWIDEDVYYVNSQNMNEIPVIPEPFTLVLAGLGIGTVAGLKRRAMR